MAQRHRNRKQYFEEQAHTTKKYVLPFIEQVKKIDHGARILEIGCGEGGNMRPFLELGCEVIGVDINNAQLERARGFYHQPDIRQKPTLYHEDIYNMSEKTIGSFDVIMMRDVIEHIPHQERFMGHLAQFLKDDGIVFFGFPPWYMPFGGHQQMCRTRWGKLSWIHLLPRPMYEKYLRWAGENEHVIASRLEIYDTGITIDRFLKIIRPKYAIRKLKFYFFNPNYEVKFGLKPVSLIWPLGQIPWIRNFYTTCCYAVLSKQ